ncbi:MAG: T9SS type A sorting domain-containing protein [Chlorobi bacterium]|nr:T9SS type A sorting domain-containing protein [Chlorobiota bacterium]
MKKILLPGIFLFAALFSFTIIFNFSLKNAELTKLSNNNIKIAKKHRAENKNLESDKTDSPELFAKYYHDIRTRNGELSPSYPFNYKIKELLKAKNVKNTAELSTAASANSLEWTERGPGNVSGRTRGIIVDPDDPALDTWFVGSVGGGVWKTTNAGDSWTELTKSLTNLATSTLAMAMSNHDVIYVGTGEGFNNVDQIDGSGIWKTTDRGVTWEQLASTDDEQFGNIMRIVVDPNDENIVLAASAPGFNGGTLGSKIFRSTDGGETWTSVYDAGNNDVQQIVADPSNFNILYATVNPAKVIKSINAGVSWSNSSNGISQVSRLELAVSPVDPNRIYISAEGGNNGTTFFYSTDAGNNWIKVVPNIGWLGGQGWYDNTIAAHPYDVDVCYVGGINLWKVTVVSEGSIDLKNITDGYGQYGGSSKGVHVDQHNIVMTKMDEAAQTFRLVNGNDGGVSYSDNGGTTFSAPKNGYNTTQFYGVDKKNGASAYIGGMQDNSSWQSPEDPDNLTSWSFRWGGDGYEAAWHYTDPNKILVSSQYNNIGKSTNGGASFSSATDGMDDVGSGKAPFFSKIAKSKQDPELIFLMGASGVWRSPDFASSWRLIEVDGAIGGTSTFAQIKISLADPQVIWTGAQLDPGAGLFVSTNGGYNFEETNGYDVVNMGRISGLATDPVDPNTAYALFSFAGAPKVLRTTDLGQTWTDISGFETSSVSSNGFPDVANFSLVVMPYDRNIIWAGTEIGIFESTNNGADWHFLDSNFPAVAVYDLSIVNDEVIAATHGRGIWSISLPELAGYEPPTVLLPPVMSSVNYGAEGIDISVNLRAAYDSSVVFADDIRTMTIFNDSPVDTNITVSFQVDESRKCGFKVVSYDGDKELSTEVKYLELFTLENPQPSYKDDFTSDQNNFVGESFSIKREFGFFGNSAIHSIHPYNEDKPITYTLKVPITVASDNAFINYKDVAILEPGEAGSSFGDENFYDYAVVEGSVDGISWIPLADGYDATYNSDWLEAYNSGGGQYALMFQSHSLNLLDFYSPGDVVLIRFRLFSDPLVVGWGWVIDDLEIQDRLTGIEDEENQPFSFELKQNYPNPFNPSTTIEFVIPENIQGSVSLKIFDILGREAATLLNENLKAGYHKVIFDASKGNRSIPSGVYFYKLDAGNFSDVKKAILLK